MDMGFDHGDDDGDYRWTASNKQPIDFVELTGRYGLLVRNICEQWVYDEVVRYIRTMEYFFFLLYRFIYIIEDFVRIEVKNVTTKFRF